MNHYVNGYLAVMQVGLGAGAANDSSARQGPLEDSLSRLGHRVVTFAYAIGAIARRSAGRVRARQRQKRAVRELERLDDRTLRDIGINRADIRQVVRDVDSGITPRRVEGIASPLPVRQAAANGSLVERPRREVA